MRVSTLYVNDSVPPEHPQKWAFGPIFHGASNLRQTHITPFRLITENGALHTKLILLVDAPQAGKPALLAEFAGRVETHSLRVGSELGCRMAAIPKKQRHLQAGTAVRELTDGHVEGDLLIASLL